METHVKIKLFATLKKYSPADAENYSVEPGTTVGDLLEQLGIPEQEAKIIFIDSVKVSLDTVLNEGMTVSIFPPIGGG
ncbi:MAG: MoaD/ThiS family protein [Deltaproteobacteria bacterium]|nr:MAG: MoaD/ThiS family protein [Deltaproteobacteria bacterium]